MTTMVYNSDNFVVVELDVPVAPREGDSLEASDTPLLRGGYEIVDKFARKEIYIEGAMAQHFREGVEELARGEPTLRNRSRNSSAATPGCRSSR